MMLKAHTSAAIMVLTGMAIPMTLSPAMANAQNKPDTVRNV
jgi:hypothetical protein